MMMQTKSTYLHGLAAWNWDRIGKVADTASSVIGNLSNNGGGSGYRQLPPLNYNQPSNQQQQQANNQSSSNQKVLAALAIGGGILGIGGLLIAATK